MTDLNILSIQAHRDNAPPFPSLDESRLCFPVVSRPLQSVPRDGPTHTSWPVDGYKGIYRAIDDPEADKGFRIANLGVVGDGFKIIRNRDVYEAAEAGFIRSMTPSQLDGATVTEKQSFQGAWTQRQYTFPAVGGMMRSLGVESRIGYQVFITNAYDGSSSLRMLTGLIDFYCENGMLSGTMIAHSRRRHTSGLTIEYVSDVIDQSLNNLQEEIRRLQVMNQSTISSADVATFCDATFSGRRSVRIYDRFLHERAERGTTVWALYSAMTFYASHDSSEFGVRNTGNDNVAKTLSNRADEVAGIVAGAPFQALLAA